MEEQIKQFYVLVRLPNGEPHTTRVCGYSIWHAIDNLYTKHGFSRVQPDRTQYKQHFVKKRNNKTKKFRCSSEYLKNFGKIFS